MENFFNNEEINSISKQFLEKNLLNNHNDKFGYFIINKKNLSDICIINNHPDWFNLYIKNNHQIADPVVMKSLSTIESFSWNENTIFPTKPAQPKVMFLAREHNINSGHTFIIHDYRNNLALFSTFNHSDFNVDKNHSEYINHQLSLFVKLHQKFLSMYEILGKNAKKIEITKRENEVLYWLTAGKTYKEIAEITHLTESTIKFHMGKIVHKLGAVNSRHAIILASELKLITPPF